MDDKLIPHQNALNRKDYFVFISVTTAAKALIMQSNTDTATLEISGTVKNLVPTGSGERDIDATLNLKISKYNEASFIKDWSANVPVFFTLVRLKKKFENYREFSASKHSPLKLDPLESNTEQNPYVIEVINPLDFI